MGACGSRPFGSGAVTLLVLWTSTTCRLVRSASGCWSSTPGFGAPLFWGTLPLRLWPRSAWTLLWALFRGLGRGRPLTARSRSTISSRVHSWTVGGRGQGPGQRRGCGAAERPAHCPRAEAGSPPVPRPLTIAGQEHGPVHQALQSLPEQLAGGEAGLQVEQALQHGQQLGGGRGAAHLGAAEERGSAAVPLPGGLTTVGFRGRDRPRCRRPGPGEGPEPRFPDGHAAASWGWTTVRAGCCPVLGGTPPSIPGLCPPEASGTPAHPRCLQVSLDAPRGHVPPGSEGQEVPAREDQLDQTPPPGPCSSLTWLPIWPQCSGRGGSAGVTASDPGRETGPGSPCGTQKRTPPGGCSC